ncbi:hypothetical protein ThrDRAFT_00242 [Frankia casuarinae]|uniref:Uncharacterized protein n=1 Tax=Frankia casuarinae (strain DSM 45818 / CECT 9043 / HFP020203 / CcI3) TaxID=106370 RepID=Q2JEN5_FRACC|nr:MULTISPECIES: hypothetical protein [Frankia]ABD10257.1 hypothetical protein Francci3_0873 [Frankia casuarinae]ESZ99929.1 hypothetical protein CcI6DRAFT_04653 [Frankia sp. CcI6]EYT93872.1 hypothetical protein ThrDRAFT_00242 [Frankia casuarinae]KDA43397.1 hypothetical protein BMG523Draft_01716 [Frankia sp. BMG5.23]OAA23468.1 hypothetical protein AAY23_10535 [Frankia casuarinae]
MARLLAAISTGVALLVGGLTALAVMLPPEYGYLVPIVIILVVVGVNITAWLVIPRVVGPASASASASVHRSIPENRPMGGSFVFGRGEFDWARSDASDASVESSSDNWSSSWDYAGGDGPDGSDDESGFDDDRWYGSAVRRGAGFPPPALTGVSMSGLLSADTGQHHRATQSGPVPAEPEKHHDDSRQP